MSRPRHRLAGFTLVEVMLTTVLAAVLLLALWSLLSMYSKAFEGGHARTEQSQLARALLEQMSTDFHNVLVAPRQEVTVGISQSLVNAASSSTSSGRSPAPSIAPASPTTPAKAIAPAIASLPNSRLSSAMRNGQGSLPATRLSAGGALGPAGSQFVPGGSDFATSSLRPAGLFGTTTFLQIDVVQPPMFAPPREPKESVVDPESPPRADELKTVVYAFEEYRDPANPAAEPTTRLIRRELSWAQAHPARGAERGETATGGAFTADPLNEASTAFDSNSSVDPNFAAMDSNPLEASGTQVSDLLGADGESLGPSATTIPEVLAFSLRYFDGAVWSEEWDSVSRQALPTAIEVSLRLQSLEEAIKPAVEDLAESAGVDQEKVVQLKHPLQRLLIPLPFAPQASAMSNMQPLPPADGKESLLGAETHAGFNQR